MDKKIQKYIQKIEISPNHEERQIIAVQGTLELLNSNIASLYSYSSLSKMIDGIFKITKQGKYNIYDHKEDARNMPIIYSSLIERKTKYVSKKLIHQISRRNTLELKPFLVTPIFNHYNVIGYIATFIENENSIDGNLLDLLTYYGNLLGEIFIESTNKFGNLTDKEIAILQRLSMGEVNKEIANHLSLSPFTVQDYIKSIMKKLEVKTRIEAVATALRLGIIK